MIKKGSISVNMVIAGALAFFILLAYIGVWQKYSLFIWFASLFPGFNQTIPEGTSVIGINLENGDFGYFTGEKWRNIDVKSENFVMGSYDFKPQDIKDSLQNFYLNTKRRPENINLEVNHWRYWNIQNPFLIQIKSHTKNGFVGPDKLEKFIVLTVFDKINYFVSNPNNADYVPDFIKIDLSVKPSLIADVINWRDSLLEGNDCEKFLALKIKENGVLSEKNYTVRKTKEYVFVDLGKPVFEEKDEKWSDENCFDLENYSDQKTQLLDSTVKVTLFDKVLGKNLLFGFDSNGWTLPDSRYETGSLWWKETKSKYGISGLNTNSFTLGLAQILNEGGQDIKSLVVETKISDKSSVIYQNEEILQNDLDKVLYNILNEYNKQLIPKEIN